MSAVVDASLLVAATSNAGAESTVEVDRVAEDQALCWNIQPLCWSFQPSC